MNNGEVIEKLDRGYRMPKPVSFECPQNVYNKMLDCWKLKSDERPTFVQLYSFFESYTYTPDDHQTPQGLPLEVTDNRNVDSYEPDAVKYYKDFPTNR